MDIVKTKVECPECRSLLCDLCAMNGMCQDCKQDLPEATVDAVFEELEGVGSTV